VEDAEEVGRAEHLLNVYACEMAAGSCADFLGYVEVAPEEARGRVTAGNWLVWRYEGSSTLQYFLRRRDCLRALGRGLGVSTASAPATAMKQLLENTEKLHQAWLVHRDMKPANVILSEAEGRLKFVDLGAMADMRRGTNYVPDESLLDPLYCAPEQFVLPVDSPNIAAQPTPVALATSSMLWRRHAPQLFDMYSLGIILLQISVPTFRADAGLRRFAQGFERCEYDLAKWREQYGRKLRASDTAVLDAEDGAGWELMGDLLRPRDLDSPGAGAQRPEAANALKHRFFLQADLGEPEPEPTPAAPAKPASAGLSPFEQITAALSRLFDLEARVQLQSEALKSQTARVKSLTGKVKAGDTKVLEELKEARGVQEMMKVSLGGLQKDLAEAAEAALTTPPTEKMKKGENLEQFGGSTGRVRKNVEAAPGADAAPAAAEVAPSAEDAMGARATEEMQAQLAADLEKECALEEARLQQEREQAAAREQARLDREERTRQTELRQQERARARAEKADELRLEREEREKARAERVEQLREERKRRELEQAEERDRREKIRAEESEQRMKDMEEARVAMKARADKVLSGTGKVLAVGAKIGGLFAKIGSDIVWELGKGTLNAAKKATIPTSLPPSPTAVAYSAVDKLQEFRAKERAEEAQQREARAAQLAAKLSEEAEMDVLLRMEGADLDTFSKEELRSGSRKVRAQAKKVEAQMQSMQEEILDLEEQEALSQQQEEVEDVVLDILRAAKEEVEEVEVELLEEAAESELPTDDSWDSYYASLLRPSQGVSDERDSSTNTAADQVTADTAADGKADVAAEVDVRPDSDAADDPELARGDNFVGLLREDRSEEDSSLDEGSLGAASTGPEKNDIESALNAAESANDQLTEQLDTVMEVVQGGIRALAENAAEGTERVRVEEALPAKGGDAEPLLQAILSATDGDGSESAAETAEMLMDDAVEGLEDSDGQKRASRESAKNNQAKRNGNGVVKLGFGSRTGGGQGFGGARLERTKTKNVKSQKWKKKSTKKVDTPRHLGGVAAEAETAAVEGDLEGAPVPPASEALRKEHARMQEEYDRIKRRMQKMEALLLEKEAQLKQEAPRSSRTHKGR